LGEGLALGVPDGFAVTLPAGGLAPLFGPVAAAVAAASISAK
jgi:hypothetical protein